MTGNTVNCAKKRLLGIAPCSGLTPFSLLFFLWYGPLFFVVFFYNTVVIPLFRCVFGESSKSQVWFYKFTGFVLWFMALIWILPIGSPRVNERPKHPREGRLFSRARRPLVFCRGGPCPPSPGPYKRVARGPEKALSLSLSLSLSFSLSVSGLLATVLSLCAPSLRGQVEGQLEIALGEAALVLVVTVRPIRKAGVWKSGSSPRADSHF